MTEESLRAFFERFFGIVVKNGHLESAIPSKNHVFEFQFSCIPFEEGNEQIASYFRRFNFRLRKQPKLHPHHMTQNRFCFFGERELPDCLAGLFAEKLFIC